MKKYTVVVLTNPTKGKEAEFNRWYDDQHIPDVLKVKGFVRAQRFKLTDTQMSDEVSSPHGYLALYEIETDDLAGSIKDLQSRAGTADMMLSDAVDLTSTDTRIFQAVAAAVEAKGVARSRH